VPDPGRGYHARMTAFDSVVLSTQRLRLRPLRGDDAPALLTICSDPQVMRYSSSPPWHAIEQAQALIARDREAMAAGQYLRLGIERDGGLIGYCTLFQLDPQNRRAELGYVLAVSAWSHGYMGEALRALLDYGFGTLDLHRVEADTDPRNRARCVAWNGWASSAKACCASAGSSPARSPTPPCTACCAATGRRAPCRSGVSRENRSGVESNRFGGRRLMTGGNPSGTPPLHTRDGGSWGRSDASRDRHAASVA